MKWNKEQLDNVVSIFFSLISVWSDYIQWCSWLVLSCYFLYDDVVGWKVLFFVQFLIMGNLWVELWSAKFWDFVC